MGQPKGPHPKHFDLSWPEGAIDGHEGLVGAADWEDAIRVLFLHPPPRVIQVWGAGRVFQVCWGEQLWVKALPVAYGQERRSIFRWDGDLPTGRDVPRGSMSSDPPHGSPAIQAFSGTPRTRW